MTTGKNQVATTKAEFEPFWLDETDWLCAVEFLPENDPESRALGAKTIGYLFAYAELTNTRSLSLIGDKRDQAYVILFSFSSVKEKREFLRLIGNNPELGPSYLENDLLVPSPPEIKNARPLKAVLPADVTQHAVLIAGSLLEEDGHSPGH